MSLDPNVPSGLGATLNIRLSLAEKKKVAMESDFAKMSMAEIVRARLNGAPIVAAVDYEMINAVRKATGLVKNLHVESNGAYSEETRAAVNALTALAKSIIEKHISVGPDRAGR